MKKLTKSSENAMIAGVCGGIAEYFDIDPTLVRIGYVVITFMGIGSPVLLYIIMALIMPEG
jgi:phage shock protein PspC (stress-responsive transcriptional regulator)